MGIKDVIRLILARYVVKKIRLKDVISKHGSRIVVDFSCWMHMALYGVAVEVVRCHVAKENSSAVVSGLARWFYTRLDVFREAGCTAIHFVLDGEAGAAKGDEAVKRAAKYNTAKEHAEKLLSKLPPVPGQTLLTELRKACSGAVKRELWMERAVLSALDRYNETNGEKMAVSWEVAPKEADGQIVHLFLLGRFDVAVAEDQDLIKLDCQKKCRTWS